MENKEHPWRNCKTMRLLNSLYFITVGILGVAPAIFIILYFEGSFYILLAIAYFFLILKSYLWFIRYIDKKLEKKWLIENF